jgi:hypothetical protein
MRAGRCAFPQLDVLGSNAPRDRAGVHGVGAFAVRAFQSQFDRFRRHDLKRFDKAEKGRKKAA